MKILWHSVAPWAPTGYGSQTRINTTRIRDLGHDVALSLYYGWQGGQTEWRGMRVFPPYSAPYGADTILPNALHHFGAERGSLQEAATKGLIVTLGDVWTFDSPLLNAMSFAAWTPVDHLDVPDVVRRWFNATQAVPIAMSRFGQRALAECNIPSVYVPHSVETDVFRPGDKAAAREVLGIPADAFVVGMVANNVGKDGNRKAFAEQILAFGQFHRQHSDAYLVLHTDVDQPVGMRLRPFLERTLERGSYSYTDQSAYRMGLPPAMVANVYRSFDVLTNCSYGEGFGIPIIEAQACGVPVIVTDATAMPELCGAGWRVPYEMMWHESQGGWAAKPRVGDILEAFEVAYRDVDDALRAQAYTFAVDNYDSDHVAAEYWKPVLDQFELAIAAKAEALRDRPARKTLRPNVREGDGFLWLDRGGKTGDSLGWSSHESELWPILDGLLPDGGVFLDVGSHVGHWTIRLAGKAGAVWAVEANPDTASTLRRNLALNDITNVSVVEVAAWDESAWLRLDDPGNEIEGGSTRTVELDHNPVSTPDHDCVLMACDGYRSSVRADRLDKVLRHELPKLDLVKMDVEGADLHALEGMRGLLADFRPVLFIECHDIYGYYKREDLERLLDSLGYSWETAMSYSTAWQPTGTLNEPKLADYLVCRPNERGSNVGQAEGSERERVDAGRA